MLQTVLNSTEGRPLCGNLRYCVSDGIDCVSSCNTAVVCVVALSILADYIQVLDTEVLGGHLLDTYTDLVVHVGISAYMKVEVQSLLGSVCSLLNCEGYICCKNSSVTSIQLTTGNSDKLLVNSCTFQLTPLCSTLNLISVNSITGYGMNIGSCCLTGCSIDLGHFCRVCCFVIADHIGLAKRLTDQLKGTALSDLRIIGLQSTVILDIVYRILILAGILSVRLNRLDDRIVLASDIDLVAYVKLLVVYSKCECRLAVIALDSCCRIVVRGCTKLVKTSVMTFHCDGLRLVGIRVALEEVGLVELRGFGYTVDLSGELVNFVLDGLTVGLGVRAVGSLYGQFVHTLKHIVNFGQGTFSCLNCGYTILCVC